jgi:hypothetical protein
MNNQTTTQGTRYSYIGSVNSSAKIEKGEQFGIDTFVVYLAPSNSSGFNVCPMATASCIAGCLNESGRVIMDTAGTILRARIMRTQDFYNDRENFCAQLFAEITLAKMKAKRKGNLFCVRLNGTSDLSPELFRFNGRNIFETFPDVMFYDYTKVFNRSKLLSKYSNYHITFSYSGENWTECETQLKQGRNVSVVFNVKKGKDLPKMWNGFPVIDGDLSDYRIGDGNGVIVGLRFKRIKDKAKMAAALSSSFVVSNF